MEQQLHQATGVPPPQFPPSATDAHHISAANPTPSHPPSHPTYTEMITAAILWDSSQGKAGGSSKRAIAKYIERVYTNLPPDHSELLTINLKRLKKSGQLVMIRNSYQLPVVAAATSSQPPPVAPVPVRSIPPSSSSLQPSVDFVNPTPKKRPGRPAKPKPLAQPITTTAASSPAVVGNGPGKRPRGRPARQQQQQPVVAEVPFVQPISQPVVQSVYHADLGVNNGQQPVKKRPGRPPRKQVAQAQTQAQTQAQFQPSEQTVVVVPVNGTVGGVVKRRPGRPPKVNNGVGGSSGAAVAGPKPRGRPKRNVLAPAVSTIGKKPRGRPPRQGGIAPAGKRRGRPPKGSVPSGGQPKLVRKYAGKPRGRPKKNASIAGNQTSEQVLANEELMRKVQNMQAIIGDAVGVLRPCIANENAPDALLALQRLEDISTMNFSASPTPIQPPTTAMSVDATVHIQPGTSMPAPESTIAPPPPATMTVLPTMAPPVVPFSIAAPAMTETAPLYVPTTIESQQPASWIPTSDAQL
ncbi:hypothetical protein BVRB_1g019670 [Beta vulgaris subsp. vulgaris]|uniref:SH3 domain-containing protein C23A1.17 n=1 Tax=Beta vulgaris subsp. vulgaris TaxID=3555 RepID=UPI00053FB344|nr:SH3 domain-containing protein C23A1.17 [Beta vulgaris subsp. vulgaris]KMT00147.1 hypothetical protein BVRB_1g019670 [Beta vulgaris subsp. vulgaris]